MHCQNYVNQHVFVEDNSPWKCKFFIFAIFFFSTLDNFSEKIYQKTWHFYNIFSKSITICARLASFTLWIFFCKIWWPFQFNAHFFYFPPLLRENLCKDLAISWLIFKVPIVMCTLTNLCHLKIFCKNLPTISKC